jgi:hypothetical protein
VSGPWEDYGSDGPWEDYGSDGPWNDFAPGVQIAPPNRPRSASRRFLDNAAVAALDSASLGFGDEIEAGAAALIAAARGRKAGDAYRDRVAVARARLEEARQDTAASIIGGVVGAAVPFGGAMKVVGKVAPAITRTGARLAKAGGGRGARAVGAQALHGGLAGAAFGGVYGLGSGDGDARARAQKALESAAFGAGQGAVFGPIYSNLVSPAVGKVARAVKRNTWDRLPSGPQAGRLYSVVGPPMDGPTPPRPPSREPSLAARDVDKIIGRQRLEVDELEARIARAKADPQGRVLADELGDQGNAKLSALAQTPGQTGQRARDVAEERAHALPERLNAELRETMGVTKSPTQARADLEAEYREVSKTGYAPVLTQQVSQEQMARLEPILARFPERIRKRAEDSVDELARIDGLDPAALTGAQRLHYLKMALDDAIEAGQAEGIGAGMRTALRRLKGDFLRAIEGDEAQGIAPIIPGYRQAREKWGSLKDAEEALDAGRKAFSRRPEEVAAQLETMTRFEREHFRIAAADEIGRRIDSRGREVGSSNVANAINARELQNTLRVIFDDAAQAERFLARANEANRMVRNSQAWLGGSDTVKKAAQLADQDGLWSAITDVRGTAKRFGRKTLDDLLGPGLEARNDALGRLLLRAIDDGDQVAEREIRELIADLRVLDERRRARGASAGSDGATSAIVVPEGGE